MGVESQPNHRTERKSTRGKEEQEEQPKNIGRTRKEIWINENWKKMGRSKIDAAYIFKSPELRQFQITGDTGQRIA